MDLSELELKRGDEVVLKANLTAINLIIDVKEKLYLTIKDSNDFVQVKKIVVPGTMITVNKKNYLCIKH